MRKSSDYFFRQALAVILLAGVLPMTAQIACAQEKQPVTNTVIESANNAYTETIFRVESNLAGEIVSRNDVYWGVHRFGGGNTLSNFMDDICQLIPQAIIEFKYTLICSIAIYFALQNLVFRKPKTQRAMVSLITISCFFCGIGYGWL